MVPMSVNSERRNRVGGSFGSVSSASGASPVSSEGNADGFYNSNPTISSGRSLDQLYKSSVDADDVNMSSQELRSQYGETHAVVEGVKAQLAQAETERKQVVDECNRQDFVYITIDLV